MLKRSKKGFTLAELLIVVAIIAVLISIAVPLFVSSLNKAQKARDDANVRAVRGAAVAAILGVETTDTNYSKLFKDGALVANVVATAKVDSTGTMTNLTIKVGAGSETEGLQTDGTYLAKISAVDLTPSFSLGS